MPALQSGLRTLDIAIFGIGAMGCLFGSRLAAHVNVTLVGHWPQQRQALAAPGLQIVHPDGRTSRHALAASDDPAALAPVDVALVLTKSPKTERVAQQVVGVLKPEGLAVTLQNGLGNLEILQRHLGAGRLTQGVTAQGAYLTGPGHLVHAGEGPTHLAALDHPLLAPLAALFERAGFPTQVEPDLTALIWGKLVANAAINTLTAILRVPNGALLTSPSAARLMRTAAREVGAVARAKGISLPFEDPAEWAQRVARLTRHNRSSMLQDVLRGAETEVDFICGAVAREAQAAGVPTPVNVTLCRVVSALRDTAERRIP